MSDSEEENFCFYGKPLEQYDEDSVPKRKPIPVEEQVATDSHGRRRFHGAFTGGFSAGFYNSVGSLEGWKPSEFKSSRSEKADQKNYKPEDYMDDEDFGEHGIAPQAIRAKSDYAVEKKRKRVAFSEGPIPGIPVLHSLIEAGNETIGYLLMKNMDLKTRTKPPDEDVDKPKVYGCVMPKMYEIERNIERDDIIPEIYKEYLKNPKDNTFGLGYVGLDKTKLNSSKSTQLVVKDQNNRKLAISGQAFGVGAFENDDEDIYAKDDMSQYDFELTSEKINRTFHRNNLNHPEFVLSSSKLLVTKQFPLLAIPSSFVGKHKIRKSRFEPVAEEENVEVKRKDMNALIRAKYIGEDPQEGSSTGQFTERDRKNNGEPSKNDIYPSKINKDLQKIKEEPVEPTEDKNKLNLDLVFGKFVSASSEENPHNILERVEPTYTEHGTKEMRDAAKLNMFGPLTRTVTDWSPCALLCKRFNVREPTFDDKIKNEPRKKSQILFEAEKIQEKPLPLKPGLEMRKEVFDDEHEVRNKDVDAVNKNVEEHHEQFKVPETIEKKEENNSVAVEKKVLNETDKIDVAKNIDLFKAVFLSSSESESEDDKEVAEDKEREILVKENVLKDVLIPKIRSGKLGILSDINFVPRDKSKSSNDAQEIKSNQSDLESNKTNSNDINLKDNESDDAYGPKLPSGTNTNLLKNVQIYKSSSDDEWVEKDEINKKEKIDKTHETDRKKSHKHKKKHKKEKHHKKSKEKHKHKK